MSSLLSNLRWDWTSFWLGLLSGILFSWLLNRLFPSIRKLSAPFTSQFPGDQKTSFLRTKIRLTNEILKRAQSQHLASCLFSLDEILIPPRLFAAPSPGEPANPHFITDITDRAIPYLPGWPELASYYKAPSLSLTEALQGGANIVITGQPGSGKTVALSSLAAQVARHEPVCKDLADFLPVLIHAADIQFPESGLIDLLEPVARACPTKDSVLPQQQLLRLLRTFFREGKVLFLLDGLDELPKHDLEDILRYLEDLISQFPRMRVVTAARPEDASRLAALGLVPLQITPWNKEQKKEFTRRWSELWSQFIQPTAEKGNGTPEQTLFNNWLVNDRPFQQPLEFTLKTWAFYAGDLPGPKQVHAIEAYLARMLSSRQETAPSAAGHSSPRQGLEQLAFQMALSMNPTIPRSQLTGQESAIGKAPLAAMIDAGLLISRQGDRISFNHPTIAGYLAGWALARGCDPKPLLEQEDWSGKSLALGFQVALAPTPGRSDSQEASRQPGIQWLEDWLKEENLDYPSSRFYEVARWLRMAPEDAPWRAGMLQSLLKLLQDKKNSMEMRARCLTALVALDDPAVTALLRKSLVGGDAILRQLACLGCGALHITKSIPDMSQLLDDPSQEVREAACLGLIALEQGAALEAVATMLLEGDPDLRRACAEAMANDPEEGHPILEEGSQHSDLQVRRAAVYGLARISLPWSLQLLQKISLEDDHWAVRTAAGQALETISRPSARIPQRR